MTYIEQNDTRSPVRAVEATSPSDASTSGTQDRRLEDTRLLRRYHQEGDLAAREEIVERFIPLARQLASRYRHAG